MKNYIENESRTYRRVPVYGVLYTGNKKYFLLSPQPIALDTWMRDERAFLVASTEHDNRNDDLPVYPEPFHVIVSGTWHVSYRDTTNTNIFVCSPENEFDLAFADLIGEFQETGYPFDTGVELEGSGE